LKRTFVDSGVLIAAAIGTPDISVPAREALDDPEREFVSSEFVRLEVLPKAVHYRHHEEAAFYAAFFEGVAIWVPVTDAVIQLAYEQACRFGLAALDGLHVAAASASHCDELITTERPDKPIHRADILRVVSIQPPDGSRT
jgi:predicted nucleic acid-binding protein